MRTVNLLRRERGNARQTTRATALRYEMTGRWHEALALYRQNALAAHHDGVTIKRIADLLVRMNRFKQAAHEFARLAEISTAEGSLRTAVAAWKQVGKLAHATIDPCQQIGDLYVLQGFKAEAKRYYTAAYDEFIQLGKAHDAAQVLRKLADIDPGDLKCRFALAGVYEIEGKVDAAADAYLGIARVLIERGKPREAAQVLNKGLRIDPNNKRLQSEAARVNTQLEEGRGGPTRS